jgi:small-conductance mechanosensitive channel
MRLLIAYLAERFPPRLYLPLPMIIATAASGGMFSTAFSSAVFSTAFSTGFSVGRLGVDATFALLLLAQFRAWDDLADRHRDARAHPGRVLVRATSVAPVVAFCIALAALNLTLALRRDASGVAAVVLLALIAVLAIWYAVRTDRTAAGDHLLLSKYPAMVVVVAGARALHAPARILGAALALHLAACAYEVWHDPASPLSVGGHR